MKPPTETQELVHRIERLEARNRVLTRLCAFSLIVPALALIGWSQADAPSLRVSKLEVVDSRGVPMVTLDAGRNEEGGSITLRDSLGEKRSWWQAFPGRSSLTMSSEDEKGTASTAGLSVNAKDARLVLISPDNAMVSAGTREGKPRIELWDSKGQPLFAAPWTNR